jgi:hypothetical protein
MREALFGGHGIETILELRKLKPEDPGYKIQKERLKAKLPGFTPAAHVIDRSTDNRKIGKPTGIMQIDFDYGQVKQYDPNELKQAIFSLPFVGYVGLSCSGTGFFALVAIAEPDKLRSYAINTFAIFSDYGIQPDRSKGRNYHDLRYVSYDANPLIRDNPETLRITHFRTKPAPEGSTSRHSTYEFTGAGNGLLNSQLQHIRTATIGCRWASVQRASFTMGGKRDEAALEAIKEEIKLNPAFDGQHAKYLKCAEDCFKAGTSSPI